MLRKKAGLSLIEIAVVVAIIVILVLVIIPIIGVARARSARETCAGNMKRIGLAIQNYARDHNGATPPAHYFAAAPKATTDYVNPPAAAPGTPDGRKSLYPELWMSRLRAYVGGDSSVFICPYVDRDMIQSWYFYTPKPTTSRSPVTSYGLNWRFSNGGDLGGEPLKPKQQYVGVVQTLDAPPVPCRTVLLIETQNRAEVVNKGTDITGDIAQGGNITPFNDTGQYFWAIRWLSRDSFTPYGHGSGCNIILADGHAAFVDAPEPPYPPAVSEIEHAGFSWW